MSPPGPKIPAPGHPVPAPLADADIERVQALLDRTPAPLEPLDASAVDGLLCALALQPQAVPEARWLAWVLDVEGRPAPAGWPGEELLGLLRRRRDEVERAIAARDWFDPWIFELDGDASPSESVLPWLAGFALAAEHVPGLDTTAKPQLLEPLAVLYLHFDPQDLEDADELLEVIETLEPPGDLGEAIQDVVRSLMLIADVTRPRPRAATAPPGPSRRRGATRARRPAA